MDWRLIEENIERYIYSFIKQRYSREGDRKNIPSFWTPPENLLTLFRRLIFNER